jgi:hypothetical protein
MHGIAVLYVIEHMLRHSNTAALLYCYACVCCIYVHTFANEVLLLLHERYH